MYICVGAESEFFGDVVLHLVDAVGRDDAGAGRLLRRVVEVEGHGASYCSWMG